MSMALGWGGSGQVALRMRRGRMGRRGVGDGGERVCRRGGGSDGVVSWFVVVGLRLIWLVRVELR